MTSNLESSIERASKLRIVQLYESKPKLFFYNFFIGMAHGLGAFFGATVVIALMIIFLSKFQWVPVVGEFIVQIIGYLRVTEGLR